MMHVSLVVVPLLLVTIARCLPQPPANRKLAKDIDVCPYTTSGLHFVNQSSTYQQAWSVCISLGQRLAVLDPQSSFAATDLVNNCIAQGMTGAWIAAYSGMLGLPCMYISGDGTIVQSNGEGCDGQMPVICQDLPQVTATEPSFVDELGTLFVTSTQTIQVCPTSPCSGVRNCRRRDCSPCQGARLFTDSLGNVDKWPVCCDHQGCDPLCPTALSDLYILNAGSNGIPYSLADRECQKYGLHLADLTAALLPSFANLTALCAADEVKFWVRSFDGVGGNEQCVWAQGGQAAGWPEVSQYYPVGFGVVDGACFGLTVDRVLCQDRPAAQLGIGPFVGSVTAVTTTSVGIQYFTTVVGSVTATTATFYP
jgi:hypothetical protein